MSGLWVLTVFVFPDFPMINKSYCWQKVPKTMHCPKLWKKSTSCFQIIATRICCNIILMHRVPMRSTQCLRIRVGLPSLFPIRMVKIIRTQFMQYLKNQAKRASTGCQRQRDRFGSKVGISTLYFQRGLLTWTKGFYKSILTGKDREKTLQSMSLILHSFMKAQLNSQQNMSLCTDLVAMVQSLIRISKASRNKRTAHIWCDFLREMLGIMTVLYLFPKERITSFLITRRFRSAILCLHLPLVW